MQSTVIYLIANPGVGKYTIAKELEKFGFVICDNQLINNPIFALLKYDGFAQIPDIAWDAIARIRGAILDFLALEANHNYVLTNCLYENEGDRTCYENVKSMAEKRGSLFVPIKLFISEEEHLRRIIEPSRRDRWKSIDPKDVYPKEKLISIEDPNLLELDVADLSALHSAEKILLHVRNLMK